jgi:hypothetical protein
MTRRRSSLGSSECWPLRRPQGTRRRTASVDLHPALVSEGVKLTTVNPMKDNWPDQPPMAQLFGYCVRKDAGAVVGINSGWMQCAGSKRHSTG